MENENKDPIRVSVIVPVYNAESYLRICLDSILQQSLEEIEILAVDDGSKDQSAKILREYEKKYPDITLAPSTAWPVPTLWQHARH